MRYVFVEIFGILCVTPKITERPKNHPKFDENCKILRFFVLFLCNSCETFDRLRDYECLKRSKRKNFVVQEACLEKQIHFFDKTPQTASEIDKKYKKQIFNFFMQLSNFDKLGGFEC